MRQVDDAWAAKLGPGDLDAQQWLAAHTPDWAKQQGYFTATAAQKADPTIYGEYYDEAFHNHLTWDSFLADVQGSLGGDDRSPAQHGSLVNLDGYKDVANQLRDQGVLESLQRKVVSGQLLTDEEINQYAKLATLYPMLKAGALGPVGQLGVGIRDGDSGAVAAAILAGVPGEGAAAAAGKAADATADALKANVLKNIAESQAAREASGFEGLVAAERGIGNVGFDTSNLQNKLSGYLLDSTHPQNQTKANWFSQALGFDQSNWQSLAKQLYFDQATAIPTKTTQYGQTYEQIIPITGANGKTINTTFVFMRDNSGTVRLVTGIPTKN